MVLVRVLIVANALMVVMVVFHPKVASGLAGFLVLVFVVVLVSVHVVAHTVLVVLVVLVAVLVAVLVVMVVMVVSATHGGHGHLERFHVLFGFKLQHVGAFFKVID